MIRLECKSLLIQSGVLLIAIAATAGLSFVGSRWWGIACELSSVALGATAVTLAMVPPLWFDYWMGSSVASPLATVAWRLGILLPAILMSMLQIEAARNCVQVTVMACYLMTLPLESWLLIRQSRP